MIFLLISQNIIRSHRLTVRTDGFQSSNRGSIPRGTAKFFKLETKLTITPKVKNIITALLVVKILPDDFKGNTSIKKM